MGGTISKSDKGKGEGGSLSTHGSESTHEVSCASLESSSRPLRHTSQASRGYGAHVHRPALLEEGSSRKGSFRPFRREALLLGLAGEERSATRGVA